jgi:hypothetical protein
MTNCRRNFCALAALTLVCFVSSPRAQSQQGSQPTSAQQSSPSAQPQNGAAAPSGASGATGQPQTDPQMQVVQGAQQESLADAARRAKAQKAKAAAKVITDDDVSKISGRGVSVVGDGNAGSSEGSSGEANGYAASNGANTGGSGTSGDNGEKYWRGRAREIMNQIAATDQQIAKLKDEIAKSGPTGVDPNAGLPQNVIVIHDRNAQLKQLEGRKANLQKQLDDLADEGRKAGADASWFR